MYLVHSGTREFIQAFFPRIWEALDFGSLDLSIAARGKNHTEALREEGIRWKTKDITLRQRVGRVLLPIITYYYQSIFFLNFIFYYYYYIIKKIIINYLLCDDNDDEMMMMT